MIGTLVICAIGGHGAEGSSQAIAAAVSVLDAKQGFASAQSSTGLDLPRAESKGVADPTEDDDAPNTLGVTPPSGTSTSLVTGLGREADVPLDTASVVLSGPARLEPLADVAVDRVGPEADVPFDSASSEPEAGAELAEPSTVVVDPETSTIGRGRATPAPELLPLPRARWIEHRRAPRESLAQIAHRYGVTEEKLREWNELGPDDPPPRPGKRPLRVRARRLPPPRERIEHVVQAGDTWWSVALRHGVDGRDLRAYNYPYRRELQPGATLQLWIDPVVYAWITSGPDPLPPDVDREQRRGAVSIGSPADGVLRNGLRIPDDPGVWLRLPRSAYGTSHAVEQLMLAVAAFHERSDYPLRIAVGSMSRPRGGPIGGHKSHQSGRDVDLALLRRPEVPAWREIRGSRVQWDAMWQLVLALAEVDAMVIFLDYQSAQRRLYRAAVAAGASEAELDMLIQYPRGSKASRGLVRHASGHELHMHVRFGCGSFETECVP